MKLKPRLSKKHFRTFTPRVIYYFEKKGKNVQFFDQYTEVVADKEMLLKEANTFMVEHNTEAAKHEYYKAHLDEAALERLMCKFMPYCLSLRKGVFGMGKMMIFDYDDLTGSVAVSFMKAINKFDPTKGVQLQTYLTPYIKSGMHTLRREQTPGVQPPKKAYTARGKAGRGEVLTEKEQDMVDHYPQFVDDYEHGINPGKGNQPIGEQVRGFNRAEMLRAVNPNRLLDTGQGRGQLSYEVRQRLKELLSEDDFALVADHFKMNGPLTRTTMKSKAEKLGMTTANLSVRKKKLLEKLAWDPILEDLNNQMNELLGGRDEVIVRLTTKHNKPLPGAE